MGNRNLALVLGCLFVSACGGPSDGTLLRELSTADAQAICEEGLLDTEAVHDDLCLVVATALTTTPEECRVSLERCLAGEPEPQSCDTAGASVPESCTATVGDARACQMDTATLYETEAARRSCDSPGGSLQLLAPSCAPLVACSETEDDS